MAYPGDPSGPASKAAPGFVAARLTPDDFEQLAAAFRPSWEFDEAPFTGPGSMAPSELRALQGTGGLHADLRSAAPFTNGVHTSAHPAPKPATVVAEPQDSVIVDRALTAADVPPPVHAPAPTPAPTPFGPPVVVGSAVVGGPPLVTGPPPAAVVMSANPSRAPSADRLAQTRIVQRSAIVPSPKESTGSFDLEGSPFAGKSKRSLWIAVGAGAVALAGLGIWVASGRTDESAAPTRPAATAAATATPTQVPDIPPPPPETTQAPVAQVPKTVPVSALAQVPMPVQTAAPAPRPAVASPAPVAQQPRQAVAPAPRPAARPKSGGSTIVHDVPF